MYTGVFYRRYIEGLWCAAEGVIFDDWNEEENSFSLSEVQPWKRAGCKHFVGVDYGTTNPTVFLDVYDDGKTYWVCREYYQDSRKEQKQKSASEHAEDFEEFMQGNKDAMVIIDPSAGTFEMELKNRGYWVRQADNDVLDGITLMSTMIHKRFLKVERGCVNFRKEIESYVWDEKARMRGEERPVKAMDHAMDACRYVLKTTISRIRLQYVRDN